MRQQRALPDYRYCNIKLELGLLEDLYRSAKEQERSLAGEVNYRLRRSLKSDGGTAVAGEAA